MTSAASTLESYRFERLNDQRLGDLAWLYKAVYKRTISSEYLAAKYDSAYTEHIFMGFLAYDQNDLPAAYYGVIPCFLSVFGARVLAAQSTDTMTHPDHQKKGLFFALANMTYTLCRQQNIKLVYGFPNQNSEAGLRKLSWQKIGALKRFTFLVTTLPLEKIARKTVFLQKLYRWYTGIILKNYRVKNPDTTLFSARGEYISLLKNESYFQYKTYSKTHIIKAGGASVWVKIQNGLIIGDIAGFEDDFEGSIRQLKKLCLALGVHQFQFQQRTNTSLYQLLKQYAEPADSFPIMIKDLGSGIDIFKICFSFADIDIF